MSTDKRERQRENREKRIAAEWANWRGARRRRRAGTLLTAAALGALVVAGTTLLRPDDEAGTADPTLPTAPTIPPGTADPLLEPGATIDGGTPCPAADGSAERTTSFAGAPPMCLAEGSGYEAVVTTDLGAFRIDLDDEAAPLTVNNFVVLARYHYFDGDDFHRVVPGFVIQGGDPLGQPQGTGGPGYTFDDELPTSLDAYVEGSVAMANSGPGTNGSQWFVWFGPNPLPGPDFSLFGQVTDGMDVVRAIEAFGSDAETVGIVSVSIVETDADGIETISAVSTEGQPTSSTTAPATSTSTPTTAAPTTVTTSVPPTTAPTTTVAPPG